MNEQIKELVKHAGLNIDGYGYPIWGCLDGEKAKKEFLEKFAELIVHECIDILEKRVYLATREDGEQEYIDVVLLEHFGIE